MTGPAWLCNPENEVLHTPVGDESLPWKDTFYFSLLDEGRGAHLAMHMTVSANRTPNTRIGLGVRHGGRERVVVRREDVRHDSSSIGNSLAWIEIVNPNYIAYRPDFLSVFPDTVLVRCHRDPRVVIPSLARTLEVFRRLRTDHIDLAALGRWNVDY